MFWVRTGLDKLKAWVSGEAGEYDWDEAHAKYLSYLTPGPFQRAVAGGDVELVRVLLARGADPNELGSYMGQCAIEWAIHAQKKDTFGGLRRCTKYFRLRRTLSRRGRPPRRSPE